MSMVTVPAIVRGRDGGESGILASSGAYGSERRRRLICEREREEEEEEEIRI